MLKGSKGQRLFPKKLLCAGLKGHLVVANLDRQSALLCQRPHGKHTGAR